MKIVILSFLLWLTDNYRSYSISVSVSVSVLYTDHLHISFCSWWWWPPQFVFQTWLKLIPSKFIIRSFSSNLISSFVSTWAVASWVGWTCHTATLPHCHSHMLFYLYEYCYSLLALMLTNVGEILQMEIFQITFKLLPPLWPMLILMESCPYFVFKSFCFSMFSVFIWIE